MNKLCLVTIQGEKKVPFIVKKVSEHIGNSAYGSCNFFAVEVVRSFCSSSMLPPQVLIDVALVL